MKILKIPFTIVQKSWKFDDIPQKSSKNPKNSIEILNNPNKSQKFDGNTQKSNKFIHLILDWISGDIN